MASDVSDVTSYFATANEGFNTTTSGTTNSNANVVGLNSTAGLENGTVFIGVIEPGTAKEQVFTGLVDTANSQISNVVWTKGVNIEHAVGVSVADYDTGTAHNMIVTGILRQHKQDGSHANTITTDTINENTTSHGVTLDGVNIKDGKIQTLGALDPRFMLQPYAFHVGSNGSYSCPNGFFYLPVNEKLYDFGNCVNVSGGRAIFTAPEDGLYWFATSCFEQLCNPGRVRLQNVLKNDSQAFRGTEFEVTLAVNTTAHASGILLLEAGDTVEGSSYGTGNTGTATHSQETFFMGYMIGKTA